MRVFLHYFGCVLIGIAVGPHLWELLVGLAGLLLVLTTQRRESA